MRLNRIRRHCLKKKNFPFNILVHTVFMNHNDRKKHSFVLIITRYVIWATIPLNNNILQIIMSEQITSLMARAFVRIKYNRARPRVYLYVCVCVCVSACALFSFYLLFLLLPAACFLFPAIFYWFYNQYRNKSCNVFIFISSIPGPALARFTLPLVILQLTLPPSSHLLLHHRTALRGGVVITTINIISRICRVRPMFFARDLDRPRVRSFVRSH